MALINEAFHGHVEGHQGGQHGRSPDAHTEGFFGPARLESWGGTIQDMNRIFPGVIAGEMDKNRKTPASPPVGQDTHMSHACAASAIVKHDIHEARLQYYSARLQ